MKRIWLLILLCVVSAADIYAAGERAVGVKRPKVALVLCGGGAKGAAHVGALRVMEQANVPIDMIVGTSIGGLVGGLYAMGYNAVQLDSILSASDWRYLLSDNSSSRKDESFATKMVDDKYLVKIPFHSLLASRNSQRRALQFPSCPPDS